MADIDVRPLDRSLYRLILRHSVGDQLQVGGITLLSLPFCYLSLELPKTIINTISGDRGVGSPDLFGWPIDRTGQLFVLCAALLALVIINGGFKYTVNLLKGRTGERMLRRLRFQLHFRLLRFAPGAFTRLSAGELIPMMTSEVEPLGGFIGDAFALPLQQGGMLLTAVLFMFAQDPILGAAAIAFYPVQFWLIPRIQRRVNRLDRARIRGLRALGDRTGESVAGLADIRAGDGAARHLADMAGRLAALARLRFALFRWKFLAQELNHVLGQLTPFFFFAVGGSLVLQGRLSFGALVAVLNAYRDLAPPWEELLEFYQSAEDIRIKYEQIIDQFEPPDLTDPARLLAEPDPLPPVAGRIEVEALSTDTLDGVNCRLDPGEIVAIIGEAGSGKAALALALAGLVRPHSGQILLDGADLAALPQAVTGRRLAYVPPSAALVSGTIGEVLLGGLRQRPLSPARDGSAARERRRSGNGSDDPAAEWTDFSRAGTDDAVGLERRMLEVLEQVDLLPDIFRLGLAAAPEAIEPALLLAARRAFAVTLAGRGLADRVEAFSPDRYIEGWSIAENLLFGTPIGAALTPRRLPAQPYLRRILARLALDRDLVALGRQIALTLLDLFGDLGTEPAVFARFDTIAWSDLPALRPLLARADRRGLPALGVSDRDRLAALAFSLIEPKHRLGLLTESLRRRLVEARRAFAADLPSHLSGSVEFFDPGRVSRGAPLADNIVFGLIRTGADPAPVHAVLAETLAAHGLRDAALRAGLGRSIGSGGRLLSPVQRQKLAIARAVLKRPSVLIMNEAGAVLDAASQGALIEAMRAEFAGRTIVAVLRRAGFAPLFDRVLVLRGGRLVEDGSPAALDHPGSEYRRLVGGG
jgi:ABC-type multidrug transport system fused ATPase/permease subunit